MYTWMNRSMVTFAIAFPTSRGSILFLTPRFCYPIGSPLTQRSVHNIYVADLGFPTSFFYLYLLGFIQDIFKYFPFSCQIHIEEASWGWRSVADDCIKCGSWRWSNHFNCMFIFGCFVLNVKMECVDEGSVCLLLRLEECNKLTLPTNLSLWHKSSETGSNKLPGIIQLGGERR